MIMRLCEPDGWDDRDGLVGSADVFVVDYEGETCVRIIHETNSAMLE